MHMHMFTCTYMCVFSSCDDLTCLSGICWAISITSRSCRFIKTSPPSCFPSVRLTKELAWLAFYDHLSSGWPRLLCMLRLPFCLLLGYLAFQAFTSTSLIASPLC